MCGNDLVKYSNSLTRFSNPICSRFEDKPYGSEMCYGRGVCDTDPITKNNIMKSCLTDNDGNKSVNTATISIDDTALHRYSAEGQKSLLNPEQCDMKRENEIQTQFQNVLVSLFQDPRERRKNCCKEIRAMIKRNLVEKAFDQSSSELGSSRPNSPNASNLIICSSMEHDNFFQDSGASYKEPLKKGLEIRNLKPVGPFTEPFNPGNQMKLGKLYYAPSPLKKNFYKYF